MILCEKCGGQILEKNESNTNNLPICGCWVTLEPYYSAKDMENFAEWCMKNYKRMHDMNEYKGRFDSEPSGKRYNISNLRKQWENERGEK